MKGKNFLFVTGILFLVFASIGLISSIMSVVTLDTLIESGNELLLMAEAGEVELPDFVTAIYKPGVLTFSAYTSFLVVILNFILGLAGVMFCKKPEKGILCRNLGIIYITLMVIDYIVTSIIASPIVLIGLPLNLVLPILFIIGGVKISQYSNGQENL